MSMSNSEAEKGLEVPSSTAHPEAPKEDAKDPRDNSIGNSLQIIGALVGILGACAGVFIGLGRNMDGNGDWSLGIMIILSSALSCLFFLAFAEIIFLLEKIAKNTSK